MLNLYAYFFNNHFVRGRMNIELMENEQELWRLKVKKEEVRMFPMNLISAIVRFFLGIRIPGELVFTDKRIIFIYKKVILCCITKEEMLVYTMLNKLTSLSAGVKTGFLCLCKRDVITINGEDEYFFAGYKAAEIQTNISKVMNSLN